MDQGNIKYKMKYIEWKNLYKEYDINKNKNKNKILKMD